MLSPDFDLSFYWQGSKLSLILIMEPREDLKLLSVVTLSVDIASGVTSVGSSMLENKIIRNIFMNAPKYIQ